MEDIYRRQVELLIRCLPEVEKKTCFAALYGVIRRIFKNL